jgi:hypothetical protein
VGDVYTALDMASSPDKRLSVNDFPTRPVTDNPTSQAQSLNSEVRAEDCGLPTASFRIADRPQGISRGGTNCDTKWLSSTESA